MEQLKSSKDWAIQFSISGIDQEIKNPSSIVNEPYGWPDKNFQKRIKPEAPGLTHVYTPDIYFEKCEKCRSSLARKRHFIFFTKLIGRCIKPECENYNKECEKFHAL